MGSLGAPELIIILVVVLLLFGANRLPKLARSLGKAQREFKKGVEEGTGRSDSPGSSGSSGSSDSGDDDES